MIGGKYSIVLKTLLDDSQSKALIDKALSTYPLYTAENEDKFSKVMTREELNKRILDHFKYREIGFETFGRFLDELEIAMNEIMPYYNQLFISEDIINGLEDIFGNLDVTESFEENRSNESNSNSESNGTNTIEGTENESGSESGTSSSSGTDSSNTNSTMDGNGKVVKANTPQSQLSVAAQNIEDVNYASEVNWNKDYSTNETESTANTSNESSTTKTNTNERTKNESMTTTENRQNTDTSNGTTSHTLTRKGNQGVNTYAHDMLEFRDLFINVAKQIIEDPRIQELFMGVY